MGETERRRMNCHVLLAMFLACVCTICVINNGKVAGQVNTAQFAPVPIGYQNWQLPTLGGSQFWSDVRFVGGWKIQSNSETGHHRLLDGNSVRHAWGNLAHCNQELESRIATRQVAPNRGKVVIVIHGLFRSDFSMKSISDYLQIQGGYSIVNFEYASSRRTIESHARALKSVIDGLGPEVTEINFVCHSLGNIVVRCYAGDAERIKAVPGAKDVGLDPRIKRMVMLGPPNQGSRMAKIAKDSFLFKSLAGASGSQLGHEWKSLQTKLATPPFEFGIVAGGQTDGYDLNYLVLRGPDDFTVSLEEAKLAGACDLLVRPLLHGTMMNQVEIQQATLLFLQNGYFISAQQRQAIPAQ